MTGKMAEAPVAPGTVLAGRYRVDRLVAEGGFGSVYAGHHLVLDGPIAIKVLRRDRDSVDHVAAFLEEARTLAKLRHANIVSVLDAGVVGDGTVPWIALQWCDGPTLQHALADGEVTAPMSPQAAWELLRPVALAIAYAHENGVAHRDLKPSNIILARHAEERVARVLDFGLAKAARGEPVPTGDTRTREPSAFSPPYAAPEQVTASRTGPWTDVHGLALIFVELVTARAPYGPDSPLERAVSADRPTPRACGVEVGDALEAVFARALALKPGARFQSAAELISAVDAALAAGTGPGFTSSASVSAAPPRPRWRRWALVSAAVAFVVALAVVGARQPGAGTLGGGTLVAGGTEWHVQQGTWREEDGALIGSGGQVMSSAELRDGTVELDFEPIELPPDGTTIGIGFRAPPVLEREDGGGYGVNFGLGSRLRFQIFEGAHGGWAPIDPAFPKFRPSPALRPGKNHVAIDARGGAFEVRVNGELIARFEDDSYPAGRVTLYVQHRSARVRFSEIRIR